MKQAASGHIESRLQERAQEVDGKLRVNCEQALGLANELDVSPARIGDLCDTLEIKIHGCQLGCFK